MLPTYFLIYDFYKKHPCRENSVDGRIVDSEHLVCAVIHPGGPDVSEFEGSWMVEHLGFGPVSWDRLVSTATTESRRGE